MSRLIGLTLALVLVAAACGSDEPESSSAPAEVSDTSPSDDTAPAGDSDDSDDSAAGAATVEVTVAGFAFEPVALDVTAGSTVVWTNEDSTLHTVTPTDDPTGFGGGLDGSGTVVEAVFDEPGTYEYFCSIHPSMTGTINVA